jgi:hypothetical protein
VFILESVTAATAVSQLLALFSNVNCKLLEAGVMVSFFSPHSEWLLGAKVTIKLLRHLVDQCWGLCRGLSLVSEKRTAG